MTETMTEPTAAQLREPLLRALGRLTALRANVSVNVDAVRAEVYRETGYAEDQFGVDAPTGSPRLRLVIQQAFNKNLKIHGLVQSEDRGEWMLTEQGVTIAAAMLGSAANSLVAFDGGSGQAWALGSQVDTYSDDPYLTRIAAEATACFGEFSARSDVCTTCPIAGSCKAAVLKRLEKLASELRLRDDEQRRKAAQPAPAVLPDADDDINDIIRAIEQETAPDLSGEEITVDSSSKCSHCKGKIPQGEKAMWIKNRGVYHPSCYATLPPVRSK